jgi:hypothetical protein
MTYYCVLFVDDVLLLWWTDVWSVMRVIYYFCSFRVHQCRLSLLSSFSHVLIGSVLLIVLVCSWLVHQCSLCLLSSPLPSFRWGPCCSSFSLSLTYPPVLTVSIEFTPLQSFMGSVLLIFLLCSWPVHQCCLYILISPPHFLIGFVLLIFCLFLTFSLILSVSLRFTH